MADECRICGNSDNNETYHAREMQLGLRDEFRYFMCSKCGCLQIAEFPANISKYYPADYYSFKPVAVARENFIKQYLKRRRTEFSLHGKVAGGKLLVSLFGVPDIPEWLKFITPGFEQKILDMGCGSGGLLMGLHDLGYKNLYGADQYIESDIVYPNGVRVYKRELKDVLDTFDLIMFHHSFEHVFDPHSVFSVLPDKIRSGGRILIRIPIVPSFVWEKYKTDWIQLDAPRHIFLHSLDSMGYLAGMYGLDIEQVYYDSQASQLWGSEQ